MRTPIRPLLVRYQLLSFEKRETGKCRPFIYVSLIRLR
jgi:hypothetical protein